MMENQWGLCHDFLYGFLFRKGEKTLRHEDVARLLKIKMGRNPTHDLDALYEQIQPLLEAERAERLKNYKPGGFKKISIPLVNRAFPPLIACMTVMCP